jgi:hypothetical protein
MYGNEKGICDRSRTYGNVGKPFTTVQRVNKNTLKAQVVDDDNDHVDEVRLCL